VSLPTIKIGQESKRAIRGMHLSYREVVAALEADGVEKFIASWDELVTP
jgi:hypothetical protein